MSAREQLFRRVAGAFVTDGRANALIGAVIAEELKKVADRLTNMNPDRSADFSDGVEWAVDALLAMAAEAGESRG